MLYKKGVLKNPAKFTAKFMRTAASGISENPPLPKYGNIWGINILLTH